MNRSRKKLIFFGSMVAGATLTYCLTTDSMGISASVLAAVLTLLLLVGNPALTIIIALRRKKEGAARKQSRLRIYFTVLAVELLAALAAFDLLMAQTSDFNWTGVRALGPVLFFPGWRSC